MVWPAVPAKPTSGGATADATGWVDGVDAFLTATEAEVEAAADAAQAAAVQRANHTGTQAISTVTGLQTALDGKQPLATVLTNTTAAFTTAQETKLAGLEAGATADQSAAEVPFTPTGTIAASNTQAAVAEVATDAAAALTAHADDETGVHGLTDTAVLLHAVVQSAAAGAIAARPSGVPNGFVQWLLYDDPTGESLGIQSNDLVFNISGTEW